MNNQRIVLLSSLGVFVVLIFIYFYWSSGQKKTIHNWFEDYGNAGEDPYSTSVLYELLKDKYARKFVNIQRPLREVLANEQETQTNYVFVGKEIYLTEEDLEALAEYVERGNRAFLSIKLFPEDFLEFLQDMVCQEMEMYYLDDMKSVSLGLFDAPVSKKTDKLHFTYRVRKEEQAYYWEYFTGLDCEMPSKEIGYMEIEEEKDYYANFIELKYGEGYFYLHTTPIAFSNLQMVEENKMLYADQVFGSLSDGKLYWDERSKYNRQDEKEPRQSPLKYILAQPSLRWAWYLLLLGAVIYFIFYSKRRQRVIPILPANINSSIEFAETTGRLYYQSENHFKLARHVFSLFLTDLRRHYNLHTTDKQTMTVERIGLKTGVPQELITEIFELNKKFEFKKNISHQELIHFHQLIESFHKQRK